MKLLFDKKAMTFGELGKLILVVVAVLIILGIVFWPNITKAGESVAKQFDQFGDCDQDGVKNFMDKCPCKHFGAKEAQAFKGCPAGTQEQEQISDQQTCSQFVTEDENVFVPNCKDKEYKEKCQEFEGGYKTRCDLVTSKALELPGGAKQEGNIGKYDAYITKLEVFKESTDDLATTATVSEDGTKDNHGNYERDLEKKASYAGIGIKFEIKNLGSEDIPQPFYAQFYVCGADKKNCQPINNYDNWDETSPHPGFTFNPLKAGGISPSTKQFISVGRDGDACDGPGPQITCYVKLVVDSPSSADGKKQLGETNEDNNEVGFFFTLKNQKFVEHKFLKYKSIEIFGGDDYGPDPEKKEIEKTCSGYVGSDCPAAGACNNNFPTTVPDTKGCWVFASEDDYLTDPDDCGVETAVPMEKISHLVHKKINTYNDYSGYKNEKDPQNLFESWQWKAKPEGSLLCKDHEWYLCRTTGEDANNLVDIEGTKFLCHADGTWS